MRQWRAYRRLTLDWLGLEDVSWGEIATPRTFDATATQFVTVP
jgi:hypothetical protein